MSGRVRVLAVLVTAVLAAAGGGAQQATGRLFGVIQEDGQGLPGVTVTVGCKCSDCEKPSDCKCCPDESERVMVTDADGRFQFSLPAGVYRIKATLEGFASAERADVRVTAGGSTEVTVDIGTDDEGII